MPVSANPKQKKMQKRHIIFGLLVLTIVLAVVKYDRIYSFLADQNPAGKNGQIGGDLGKLADISLRTLDGEEVLLGDYAGQPLVLNAWAIWCPFCKAELPSFVAVQEEYPDDVLFIAINRSESADAIKEYLLEHDLTDRLLFLRDPNDVFYNAIGGFAMPETLFINAEGDIVEHKRGPLDEAQTRSRAQSII